MPPFIHFDQLQNVAVDQLEEDEVEQFYRDLLEVQIESVDAENVRALFNLCRNIMELKNAQTQVAFEELEQIASDKVKIGADREQELLGEIEELKQQLSTFRRQTAEANLTKDAEPLKEEIKFLTEENERLQRDFIDLRNDLLHEKEISSEIIQSYKCKVLGNSNSQCPDEDPKQRSRNIGKISSARLEEYERETRDLKKERNQLIEDVRECQRQLYSQRENVSSRRTETEDYQKKLRSRNQEMINLVDEISNLNDTNDVLQQQVKELRDSLEESVKQMEKTTDQYARLKEAVEEGDIIIENLEAENADLRNKLSEAGISTSNKPSLEDELIAEFSKKIEEWKALFQEKENELTETKKKGCDSAARDCALPNGL